MRQYIETIIDWGIDMTEASASCNANRRQKSQRLSPKIIKLADGYTTCLCRRR